MQQAAKDPARRILFVGGSRSGKTFLVLLLFIIRALMSPGSRHLICRHRFNAAKASIWMDTLPKVLRFFPSSIYAFNETDHVVKFVNGAEIWVDGLDEKERVDKILGREYATIFFNEGSQIRWSTVELVLTRLAQKVTGIKSKAFFDLNPSGKGHWSYKLWIAHVDPTTGEPLKHPEDYRVVFSTAYDNRENLAEDYIERELETMTGARRRRFLDGTYQDDDGLLVLPVPAGGAYVWADFEAWKAKQAPEDLRTTAGLDLGYEDSDALTLIVYSVADPVRWLVYEFKERHQGLEKLAAGISDALKWLDEKKLPKPPYIYTDTGGGGKRAEVDLASIYGLPTAPAYKQDKATGIELLRDDLKALNLRVPAGGIFAYEAERTVWIVDEDTGKKAIDDAQYHPDLVDSVLYAMRYVWYYHTKGGKAT